MTDSGTTPSPDGGGVAGRPLTDANQTPLISTAVTWNAGYRGYLGEFERLHGSHRLYADRLNYITLIEAYLETYTTGTVLEYDRQYRLKNVGEIEWCHSEIDPLLRHILVPRTSGRAAKISPNVNSANNRGTRRDPPIKKLREAERVRRGTCRAAEKGEKCSRGDRCRFTHTHAKCKKDHIHVWATC